MKRKIQCIGVITLLVIVTAIGIASCSPAPAATTSGSSTTADATEPPSLLDMKATNMAFAEGGFTNIIGESERKATSQAYEALAPDDIPIKKERNDDLIASDSAVVYSILSQSPTGMSIWYKREMQNNGWTYLEDQSSESNAKAKLVFEKENRVATVNIERSSKGGVDVAIEIVTK